MNLTLINHLHLISLNSNLCKKLGFGDFSGSNINDVYYQRLMLLTSMGFPKKIGGAYYGRLM